MYIKIFVGKQSPWSLSFVYMSLVSLESDCGSRGRWFEARFDHTFSLSLGHENNFYDHSDHSADSRRAVVRKNGH